MHDRYRNREMNQLKDTRRAIRQLFFSFAIEIPQVTTMSASTSPQDYLCDLFGLSGKTALITGGTRGIGASMALALARAGADVVLVQRSTENAETHDQIKALGRKVEIVVCDLADKVQVGGLIAKVVEKGHVLDIVVNCGSPRIYPEY
jgi:NADPH:quinone reductase-like Zn-dependent oxidoreductase